MMYPLNVFGGKLEPCSMNPLTGYYRDGCCNTDSTDQGLHTVCCVVTEDFLEFSRSVGNDLSTPRPEFEFPGLRNGDKWCLCAARWEEARRAGCAPMVILASTNIKTLEVVELDHLKEYQLNVDSQM